MNDTESWMTFTWFNNFCDPLYFTSLTFRYGLPWWLRVKASTWNAGDQSLIPGLGRSPGEGKWQPTPVLLPGESHGGRSLVGYSPWHREESDMTEWLHFHFTQGI